MKGDPSQSRIKVAKKIHDYLLSPLQIVDPRLHLMLQSSNNLSSKYMFLHWAIFGTKQEREETQGIYRPKVGLEFAAQKVEMLLLKMSEDEEKTLSADIETLIDIVKKKQNPKSKVQLPVELTGHPNVEPSFGTTYFGGAAASDWGMGGSLLTPDGKSYLVHCLEMVRDSLPQASEEPMERQQASDIYFLGQVITQSEPQAMKKGRFSKSALNYQDFLKTIGRGDG